MEEPYFNDKEKKPTDDDISQALGVVKPLWDDINRYIADEFQPIVEEWKFTGKKGGWSLRLLQKKRRIIYLGPRNDYFRIAVILGERAMDVARSSNLPADVLEVIDTAKKYVEGTVIRLEVRTEEDLEAVIKLALIKMNS